MAISSLIELQKKKEKLDSSGLSLSLKGEWCANLKFEIYVVLLFYYFTFKKNGKKIW